MNRVWLFHSNFIVLFIVMSLSPYFVYFPFNSLYLSLSLPTQELHSFNFLSLSFSLSFLLFNSLYLSLSPYLGSWWPLILCLYLYLPSRTSGAGARQLELGSWARELDLRFWPRELELGSWGYIRKGAPDQDTLSFLVAKKKDFLI